MRQMDLACNRNHSPRGQLIVAVENLKAFRDLPRDTQRELHFMYHTAAKEALSIARNVLVRSAVAGKAHDSELLNVEAYLPLFDNSTDPTNNKQSFDTMDCIIEALNDVITVTDF